MGSYAVMRAESEIVCEHCQLAALVDIKLEVRHCEVQQRDVGRNVGWTMQVLGQLEDIWTFDFHRCETAPGQHSRDVARGGAGERRSAAIEGVSDPNQ
ncbi:hypothetical protein BHQ18_06640 [Mycolicibacterium flavescens]|uniref:Uncharacterized protein n=1 Tax=Mycolicibacterium flavescens TaxID=1776 RepID=A0A1E3RMG7_MYCFV|nr:hypothetical protein BHQ18_06640 [Mycolicibacterium flavescens]